MGSLLANIGIIFLAFYLHLRSRLGATHQENGNIAYFIKYILLEVLLGMILLSFSTVIMGIRYDFRFLMFCFSAKFLDWKITSSSILLIGIIRFLWGSAEIAQINLIVSVVMAITLPLMVRYLKNKLSDLPQLLLLVTYCIFPSIMVTNHIIADKSLVLSISLILFTSGYAATFMMHYVISDLYSLIAFATTDHLTTLKNVRTFNGKLTEIERKKQPVTVAMIDIDRFKDYNDSFGHDGGDALLKQLGQVLNGLSRPDIDFYRVGGDEFGVIINQATPGEAEAFLVDLQKRVAEWDFPIVSGESLRITLSVGIAHSCSGETIKKTLSRADMALYEAKKDGRNKVVSYVPKSLKTRRPSRQI